MNELYKWNLTDLYPSLQKWEDDLTAVGERAKEFSRYERQLHQADALYACLTAQNEVSQIVSKLYIYAHLWKDEDTRNTEAQKLLERASDTSSRLGEATSFIVPEILEMTEDQLEALFVENEQLALFKNHIKDIFRFKKHVLSKTEEALLAKLADTTGVGEDTFDAFNDADLKFPSISLPNGEKVQLTNANYAIYIRHEDRNVRQEAYKALYHTYMGFKNTVATTLFSTIRENVRFSNVRNYPSALESSLFDDNVPKEVYHNLIQTAKDHLEPLHKYLDLRKKHLNVDELRMWDMHVPFFKDFDVTISYEEAYEKMKQGLSVLGEEYVSLLQKAKEDRWIDVYSNEGKRGGAYSWGNYSVHPYVLLNHKDNLDSMFTLAHEMGHALHSYYSNKSNSSLYAQYAIFVAEVASTVNEVLLIHHLLEEAKKEGNVDMQKFLLNDFLEQFRNTFYRQTMFAEFEYLTHKAVEEGNPLTEQEFRDIYRSLHETYYGDKVVHDEEISYEWMRIPHFYNAFYVYKYATGFSAAISIAKSILEGKEGVVDNYKAFLKSGGTDFPIELLKITGVDMSTPQPIEDALAFFNDLVNEFEGMLEA